MRALRGLEMVCLTKDGCFDMEYAGASSYTDRAGKAIDDLMDMGCVGCAARYFTREASPIDFCPACGFMERKRFKKFQELQAWSNTQSWKYLSRTGHKPFGVLRHDEWRLVFETDSVQLEMSGHYEEIHNLLAE